MIQAVRTSTLIRRRCQGEVWSEPMRMQMKLLIAALLSTAAVGVLAQAGAADQGQWVTLGTAGGPPIHANQSQIANALVVGQAIYLFDAGEGVLRQMAAANLPVGRVKVLFLTHHHPDHVMDVGAVVL